MESYYKIENVRENEIITEISLKMKEKSGENKI